MEFKASDLQFYGHETFPLRRIWLPKTVNHLYKYGNVTDYNKVMEIQGVGKNMAKSMRHWAESTQIIEKDVQINKYKLTKVGELLFSKDGDKYIQNIDTLWLLHYLLVTNHRKNALWYYLFNVYSGVKFDKDSFILNLISWFDKIEHKTPNQKQLERDLNTCMNMYCPSQNNNKDYYDNYSSLFIDLKLIRHSDNDYKTRKLSSKEFSQSLFAYTLVSFIKSYSDNKKIISFPEILFGEKSPGKVFNLSENLLFDYLDRFVNENRESFEFDSTAGLKTLYVIGENLPDKYELLKKVFKNEF